MHSKEDKDKFLFHLDDRNGKIGEACQLAGVSPSTLKYWRKSDPDFYKKYIDTLALAKLANFENIQRMAESGDVKSMVYYNEHDEDDILEKALEKIEAAPPLPVPPPASPAEADARESKEIQMRSKRKKDYIVKVLKKEGKYTAELSWQVTIVAKMLVRTEQLEAEIFSQDHSPVTVELSREGNERTAVNALERIYLDYVQQTQRALRALGMNTDSKDRKAGVEDGFADFLNTFREGGDD